MKSEDREFRCIVLKSLRTLIRAVTLFDQTKSRGWDWMKEMQEAEEELWRIESNLKNKKTGL